jgi:hypothetical protein
VAGTCAFCGKTTSLTGEHVLGKWLSRIGLDLDPVAHVKGPLNRIGQEVGVTPPFTRTVRDVCGPCNNGWMSDLEAVAKRVLTPVILGEPTRLDGADLGAIAAWMQKTTLVAMLISSEDERAAGYGLPSSEYRALYEQRELMEPLPASQFWVAHYTGEQRFASTWVTPLTVTVDGLPEAEVPHAYAMTLVLGQLVLHGLRFTAPSMAVTVTTARDLPQIWPVTGDVAWPSGDVIGDDDFVAMAAGKEFGVAETHLSLRPWTPATELARSELFGTVIELPTICGKHAAHYPARLAQEAVRGARHGFMVSCDCDITYLIKTDTGGARCNAADSAEVIERLYDELPGEELVIEDANGTFVYKLIEDR